MEENQTESWSLTWKLKNAVRHINLEPIIVLQAIDCGIEPFIRQNLIIANVFHDLGYSQDICDDIDSNDNADEEIAVQIKVSEINMSQSLNLCHVQW